MATALRIPEPSYRLGSGRYIQKSGAILDLAKELEKLGVKSPFILGGKTALSLTKAKVESSLENKGFAPYFHTYLGFCSKEHCQEIMQSEAFKKSDVVIGIGGGNVMDAAKYCAMLSKKPIVNIPTSSATCAAFTPLSVCYNERGQTVGTTHFEQEVDCVIVDMEILCRQPVRLLVSGIYDSLAKVYELKQRMLGVSQSETDIGLYSSYALSQTLSEILQNNFSQACLDTQKGENTKAVSDTVFAAIALTGVVSGLARGSNQTAIAHKIYESARYLFPETVLDFLHGEMVAIGLISQIYYNGEGDISAFKEKMKALKMPTSFSELGIAPTQENLTLFYEKIIASSAMAGTTNEEKAKLFEALKIVQ